MCAYVHVRACVCAHTCVGEVLPRNGKRCLWRKFVLGVNPDPPLILSVTPSELLATSEPPVPRLRNEANHVPAQDREP